MGACSLIGFTLTAVACAGHGRTGAATTGDECQPVETGITAAAPWDSLPGSWRLTLVASTGPLAGRRVEGMLTLRSQDPALRRMDRPGTTIVTVPVTGNTDIALEQVGAVRIGNIQSTDPLQPGLAIWVSQAPDGGVSAVLRIGQEALRTDIQRIDGGYTVLFLRQVSPTSLSGNWSSAVTTEKWGGHFCAVRRG